MAAVNEGVENLQRFVALLAQSTTAVGKVGEHVKQTAGRFGQLEDEAEERGGGLNDRLSELAATVENEESDAVEAFEDLAEAAGDAQETVGDAEEKVARAAADLEDQAGTAAGDLEQAGAELTDRGFQPLGQAMEEAQQALESEGQEVGQALAQLESAVGTLQGEAEAAWNEAEGELSDAAGEMADFEAALQGEAGQGAEAFDTAGSGLEAACTALAADVDEIYDLVDEGVEAQGQAWLVAVQVAAQEAFDFVTEGRQQRLDQPAAMLEDQALGALEAEYAAVGTLLEKAEAVADELTPVAEDLARSQGLLAKIDELTDAMASS